MQRYKNLHRVTLHWGVSRARGYEGQTICSLKTPLGRFRTIGVGYDLVGTVLGDYLEALLTQKQKQALLDAGLCGVGKNPNGTIFIDGATGRENMITLARHAGVSVAPIYSHKKRRDLVGFIFSQGMEEVA